MAKQIAPLSELKKVDKRSNLSSKGFNEEYVKRGLPVILCDAARDWSAMKKFTPSFFKINYGHLTKEINGIKYSMSEFVDRMLIASPHHQAPYPFNFNLEKYLPELKNDIQPEIAYGKSDRVNNLLLPRFMMHGTEVYEIFMGGNGSSFPFLHVDDLFLHTQITQVYGSKEFILYSPDQTHLVYPKKDNPRISQIDILNPDFGQFPLFRDAKPLSVIVEEGETILFPSGWWHTTKIHEPCISVGKVQLNDLNWNAYIEEEYKVWNERSRLIAKFIFIYGKILGPLLNFKEKVFF